MLPDKAIRKRYAVIMLSCAALMTGCTPDDPDTPWDETEIGEVTVSVDDIAGPDGTVIYGGKEQTGTITVSANAIMGVIKDNAAYLYHPGLGDAELSAETSRKAVGLFVLGLQKQSDTTAAVARRLLGTFGTQSIPTLGAGETLTMPSGLTFTRMQREDLIRFSVKNNLNRWVGLKLPDGTKRFIPPRARTFEANMCTWLKEEGFSDMVKSIWPAGQDPFDSFSTEDEIEEVDSAAEGIVDIFGATFRVYPHMDDDTYPPGTKEAVAADLAFYNLVNMMDLYYIVLEGLKNIGSTAIPFECADVAFTTMANMLEYGWLSFLTDDEKAASYFWRILRQDFYNSLVNCVGVVKTAGLWEIVETFFDIVGLVTWIAEDLSDPDQGVMTKPCYEQLKIATKHSCDASNLLDLEAMEAEVTETTAGKWCEADILLRNQGARSIWVAVSTAERTQWDCTGGYLMCKKIGPDDEHLGLNAFQSHLDKSTGECTERRITSYMAFYDTDECEDLFYNLRLNGQIPEGMTVVEFDTDVCACE